MSKRKSFFDRTKQFHRSIPRSWPSLVKHISVVLFTFAGMDDGGGITCSLKTVCCHSGEPESNVQRAQKFLRDGGFMVDEGFYSPQKGIKIPARRLVLERMAEVREAEDGTIAGGPRNERGPDTETGGVPGMGPGRGPRNDTQTESKKDNREKVQPNYDSFGLTPTSGSDPIGSQPDQPPNAKKPSPPKLGVTKAMEVYQPQFQIWYSRYPRKEAPQDALKAYAQAIVNDKATPEQLLRSLNRQRDGLLERETHYRPLPATWLRRGNWKNEPSPPATVGGSGMVGGL